MEATTKDTDLSRLDLDELRKVIRPSTVIESARLSKLLGADVTILTEAFQHTGSFKFRAAYNVASKVPQQEIIASSSGNFGQALALACHLLDKKCTVVMPANSAKIKIDAVREYGGDVDLIDTTLISRKDHVVALSYKFPNAYVASPYDDVLVIDGNSTMGEEIAALNRRFDFVIAPIGGGGLTSGIVNGLARSGTDAKVVGAEPLMANDAAQSLRAGRIIVNESEPQTIADGARSVSIGRCNWEILKDGLAGIVEVPEEKIVEGLRVLFSHANLKVEPTGALAIGAVLTERERFRGRSLCCVISGGNVDPDVFKQLLN